MPTRCSEIMKRPVRCARELDTVQSAARLMRDADVGFLPVCYDDGTVAGILTDRDIVTRACSGDEHPSTTIVGDIMTRAVVACRPDDALSKASARMRQHHLTRIVILDARRTPVGVLSLSDVAQYEHPAKVGRTLQTVTERKYSPERP
ncbi:MAG: CBS domain-containing protein [Labilithrix sp.]|nr:CBS domain-containing protein [Labilithrix sp.]MCW5834790.1 CBS domain-containing protein [Labilithrix sp.]